MADYGTLTIDQKVSYALDAALKNAGMATPVLSGVDKWTLHNLSTAFDFDAKVIAAKVNNDTYAALGKTFTQADVNAELNKIRPFSSLDPATQTALLKYVPPGYTVSTFSYAEIISLEKTLSQQLENLSNSPATATVIGKNTNNTIPAPVVTPPVTPTIPAAAPVASSQSNNTLSTVLGVGAAALGAIALVKAFAPQTAPAAVPVPAVAAPPIVTSPAPPLEVNPATNPAVVVTPVTQSTITPTAIPPAIVDTEFGTNFDSTIINNASATSIDTTGIDAQIAANQREADIIAEKQTVTAESLAAQSELLAAAAPPPVDPTEDPMAAVEAANQAELDQSIQNMEPAVIPDESTAETARLAANNTVLEQQQAEENQSTAETARLNNSVIQGPDQSTAESNRLGLTGAKATTQAQATAQDVSNLSTQKDWRVKLSLAPDAKCLYKNPDGAGILGPLATTKGIIFPYTPAISVQYAAHYDQSDITHSNYKIFQYKNSSVDQITITCDFTAQDTYEANYLVAVIHFLRSATKMFYGQDQNPKRGTPPPLCYLTGLGSFQFDGHPIAVTGFTYSLPHDVDYIRAAATTTQGGVNKSPQNNPVNTSTPTADRLNGAVGPGGTAPPTVYTNSSSPSGTVEPTYVPTKMQIQITAIPIVTRNDISNNFSLRDYATGALLQGSKRKGGGIW